MASLYCETISASRGESMLTKPVCVMFCQVQRLQNIIASRASQYNHDMKRKEREFGKMKERLNQLLVDKKEKKQGLQCLLCCLCIIAFRLYT